MRSDTLHCLGHGAGLKVGSGKVLRNWGHKPTYLCKLFPNKHGFWYPHLVIKQKNWSWNRSICGSIQWLYMPSHPWTHIVDSVRKNKVATTRSAPVIACVGGAVSIQSCCSMSQHIIVSIDTCLMTQCCKTETNHFSLIWAHWFDWSNGDFCIYRLKISLAADSQLVPHSYMAQCHQNCAMIDNTLKAWTLNHEVVQSPGYICVIPLHRPEALPEIESHSQPPK